MSLINDALRRASQTERNRPQRASTPMGMEPAPAAKSSGLTVLLVAAVLVALLLAGWFFWQLRNVRNNSGSTVVTANVAPPVLPHVSPQPVAAPKPAPVIQVAPSNPAPAPAVVATTPVVVPPVAAPPVAPPVTPPAEPPVAVKESQVVWPVDMTLSAIFFSKTNPRVLINGNLYETGDKIQGVVLKKIEKDEVTVEWNGHSKVLMLGGQ